jgi:hypothetical protein
VHGYCLSIALAIPSHVRIEIVLIATQGPAKASERAEVRNACLVSWESRSS